MGKPEAEVEGYLVRQVTSAGGICYKFTSPTTNGVPDRVIIAYGHVVFVECKRPGAHTRKLQDNVIRRMRAHGADVRVADTRDLVDEIVSDIEKWKGDA